MTSPTAALQTGLRTAIVNKMTTESYTGPGARVVERSYSGITDPYVIIGAATGIDWGSHTSDGYEATHTVVVWSSNATNARTLASHVVDALTSTTTPVAASGWTLADARLDLEGPALREDAGGDVVMTGVPVRVRFYLYKDR